MMNKELFDIDLDKLAKEAKIKQEASRYSAEKRKQEAIYKEITKDTKFVSKFVKKCQSRQTGEKTVFYDIDIEKMPQIGIWGEFNKLYDKYHILIGRSLNLSMYAHIQESMLLNDSVNNYNECAGRSSYLYFASAED